MKRVYSFFVLGLLFWITISCGQGEKSFFSNKDYRKQVKDDFQKRELMINQERAAELFSVFNAPDLTLEEKEALEFLFAYMPLSDLSDYNGDFYLAQVRAAFAARDFFEWGKRIPEEIFRHFVLVYRVNNENLDSARIVFFNELKDRVKDLGMEEAALEVNHWCHEKVTYRATDGRTSSPLDLVKTSWGRCGEESTFTTTALRAVGIPARQCYTPRWAHTDDNHAWVEVWIDGKWRYLGACEPEAKLDAAWFTAPAKRAMMVHTNVFGKYTGVEDKNVDKPMYSTINLLSNYANIREVKVKVTDLEGKSVSGAKVAFKVYNYAEYYPVAESETDLEGKAAIHSGLGDLLAWASKDGVFGYAVSSPKDETVTIVLNKKEGDVFEDNYEIVPPAEQKVEALPSELAAVNGQRLRREDSIRKAYMNTFIGEEAAKTLASELNLDADETWKYLRSAQGNWKDIQTFIEKHKDDKYLFPFLSSVSDKDLRDVKEQILTSHLQAFHKIAPKKDTPEDIITRNLLSPRISREIIRPWRKFFHSEFDDSIAEYIQENVDEIVNYVRQNIETDDEQNYYNCPVTPEGVYRMKITDKRSRNIFFVSLCRSAGIAARLNPATTRPQYYDGEWKNAEFEDDIKEIYPQAKIEFVNSKENLLSPRYGTHFSLARFQNGDFVTLNLRENASTISVDEGYYRLMTGSRANDGSVTINNKYFEIKENQSLSFEIKMPEVVRKLQVLGIIDMNTKIVLTGGVETTLKDLSNGNGVMLCFAEPDKEPTKHILQDLPDQRAELDTWNGGTLFLVPDDKLSSAFDHTAFKNLPKNTVWGVDSNRSLLKEAVSLLKLNFDDNFPLTLFLSNSGGILYYSLGYKIGTGENIVKTINSLKK
ncbi:MAG: transglutaminase domain-containing protein [Prevotellaceae bacterium]|jgi:transglutaminase-like putative cysteine protease|nr:transglutaminase domain-containing protein [Prevotellaceae bacterium]